MKDEPTPQIDSDTEQMLEEIQQSPQSPTNSNEVVVEQNSPSLATDQTVASQPSTMPTAEVRSKSFVTPKKSKKKVFIALALIAVILISAIGYILLANQEKPIATSQINSTTESEVNKSLGVAVGLFEGKTEYSRDGSTWSEIDEKTNLRESMSVRTGDNGRLVLLIDDGSAIRLSYNSEVEITSLDVSDMRFTQKSGELYSRVMTSEKRKYSVLVGDDTYTAKGTAYRTTNKDNKKGVEVFHSAVDANIASSEIAVSEGSAYLTKADSPERENVIVELDLTALKSDEFISWNTEQDKQNTEFLDKLGVLDEIEKIEIKPAPPPPAPKKTAGIALSGRQNEYAAEFSWSVTDIDTSKGYKLVRSSKSTTPEYPYDNVAYIESGKTSYTLYDGDGNTYNYRICAYRDGSCESYSNTVSVGTKKKEKAAIESGAVNLSLSGTTANWTFAGTAPYGFKLVMGLSTAPAYPEQYKKYVDGKTTELPTDLESGKKYYIRVCKYTGESCQDYSNEVTYTAP